jgi:hypothetical protein
MGLLDLARDTLKEIPMADVLRERLSLALDLAANAERQSSGQHRVDKSAAEMRF